MVRRSRLRVHSSKRRRLVSFIGILFLVIALVCVVIYRKELAHYGLAIFTDSAKEKGSARGTIFDRNYKELAISLDRVSVYARIREVSSREEVAKQLASLLGKDEADLLDRLKGDSLRVWLAKNISQEQEEELQALALQGIYLHREKERYYPRGEKAAHVVGFVEDDIGLAGVEYQYNKLLGEYGIVRKEGEKTSKGSTVNVKDGQYLVLTIDLKIQDILEKYLADTAGTHGDVQSGAILMDCSTGNIIGNANYPSYNPNRFRDYKKQSLNNTLADPIAIPYVIRQLFRNAALLQAQFEKSDIMLPWSILSETGSLGAQVRLWEKLQLADSLDLDFVTKKSLGEEQIRSFPTHAQNFETVPEVATPLHLLAAISRLVNGGESVVPHVVDRFRNIWGEEIYPEAIWREVRPGRVVDKQVSRELTDLLNSQMEKGPLESGFLEGQSFFITEKNGVEELASSGIMISLIPAQKPLLILLVSAKSLACSPIRKRKKEEGNLTAPAKKIIPSLVVLQEVMKNLSDMMTAEEREEANFQQNQQEKNIPIKLETDDLEKRLKVMPDLQGFSLRKSLRILQDLGLEIRIEGTGRVVDQKPQAGTVLGSTKECRLILEREDPGVEKNDRK